MAKNKRQKARYMADGQSYFIILLILSIWLNFIFPIRAILYAPYTYFGIIIICFGIAIGLWSRSLFLKSKTTLSPFESPTSLVTSGPFHISRNPIYLGMTAILLGIAIFLGTLVTFTFPALFMMIIETLFIPDEERKLEKIFGEQYKEYKNKVRQWI
ncbi:MAG TPA: isoprenylcysteine carboxylmethyltransferase family protein [Candidatus Methanoperedens sp.]|nr:isoprenylcysteine carboxylmethyltransferase family protein [Candidatus Methanoperedens sp.]